MANATIDLPDGTKIVIDGSVEEVARIVTLVQGPARDRSAKNRKPSPAKKPSGVKEWVRELKEEGFFGERRSLSDVKNALETRGHIYALTSLSGPMLELVRSNELGRVKEEEKWMYVHR